MPRKEPHPYAFFSLLPLNKRAKAIVEHPDNAHLVSTIVDNMNNVQDGLDIGPFITSGSRYTLATIGRTGNIKVEGQSISRIQCSFEIHEGNMTEVMLQDRSSNHSTKLFGEKAMGFEAGRPYRRVVIDQATNLVFGFGGIDCDQHKFQIVWHDRNNS